MTGMWVEPQPNALGAVRGAFELLRALNLHTNSIVHYRVHTVGAGALVEALATTIRGQGREPGASAGWAVTIGEPLTSTAWAERLASWVGFTGDLPLADDPDEDDLWIGRNATVTDHPTTVVLENVVVAPPLVVRPVNIEAIGGGRFWTIAGEAVLLEGATSRVLVDFGWSD